MASVSGTITFLFTDIEGSTRLWDRYPEQMRQALARHDSLIRESIEANRGRIFKTAGDSFCAAFAVASDAAAAAVSSQLRLSSSELAAGEFPGLRVRMAIHTGTAEERDGDYFGGTLNRVDRLLEICHGGQVLVSGISAALLSGGLPGRMELRDLGIHRLKDLQQPEQVFQLEHSELPKEFQPLRSLESTPNNLPRQLTSFIGREKELTEVKELVRHSALVTLTGTGGCGKTRLALQVSAEMLEEFPDGVWLVELASLVDSTLVINPVAVAVGARTPQSVLTPEAVQEHIGSGKMLIVLDNCEHLLLGCAELSQSILQTCPNLHVLATSRQGLGISGEKAYRVPSLSLPDPAKNISVKRLAQIESVRLFTERARAVSNTFDLNDKNAQSVAKICKRLDGIPLALELAASRINVLSPQQIDERLNDRFKILTGGSRTALQRHQTLKATIDWSYDLLTEAERALLIRLSVFAGGWTLRAAETICAGGGVGEAEVLDVLSGLVDKSLVAVEEGPGGEARYRLLETIRQYAEEKFAVSDFAEELRERHRDFFLEMAEEAAPHIQQADQQLWLDRLEADHDNLWNSLDWTTDQGDRLRFCIALHRYWLGRGRLSEGRSRLSGAIAQALQPSGMLLARAFNSLGILEWAQSDLPSARDSFLSCLKIARIECDMAQVGRTLSNMAMCSAALGDLESARKYNEESVSVFTSIGDSFETATACANLGTVELECGRLEEAEKHYVRSLETFRAEGDRFKIGTLVQNLGEIALRRCDYNAAELNLLEALSIRRDLNDKRGMAIVLISLSKALWHKSAYERSYAGLQLARVLFRSIETPIPVDNREDAEFIADQCNLVLTAESREEIDETLRKYDLNHGLEIVIESFFDGGPYQGH